MHKRLYIYLSVSILIILFVIGYSYAERNIDTGISFWSGLKKNHLRVVVFEDPENPFISVYLTHIESSFSLSDPSDMSIAVRLTGKIPVDSSGNQIINKNANINIFSISKSVLFKELKIARYYDKEKNVLIYISYSEKLISGSLKHSLSVVPLSVQE
jgi:CreA protein